MKPFFRVSMLAAALAAAGCSPSKTDLANVNGKAVTKDQLAARMLQGPESKAALRSMILESIIQSAAAEQGVSVADADITRYMQVRRDQLAPGRFEEATTHSGATDARVRQDTRTELLLRGLQMKGVTVSDESIKKIYDEDAGNQFTKPDWVQIGLVVTKDKQDALNAIGALKQGADFNTVAGKFTIPAAKQQGIALQWVGVVKGTLVSEQRTPLTGLEPAMKTAILKTPQGKVSEPIPFPGRPFNRVVYVQKRVPGAKLSLEEVKPEIAYGIAAQNNQIKPNVLDEIVKNAKIDIKADQFRDLSRPEVLMPPQNPGNAPG